MSSIKKFEEVFGKFRHRPHSPSFRHRRATSGHRSRPRTTWSHGLARNDAARDRGPRAETALRKTSAGYLSNGRIATVGGSASTRVAQAIGHLRGTKLPAVPTFPGGRTRRDALRRAWRRDVSLSTGRSPVRLDDLKLHAAPCPRVSLGVVVWIRCVPDVCNKTGRNCGAVKREVLSLQLQ